MWNLGLEKERELPLPRSLQEPDSSLHKNIEHWLCRLEEAQLNLLGFSWILPWASPAAQHPLSLLFPFPANPTREIFVTLLPLCETTLG